MSYTPTPPPPPPKPPFHHISSPAPSTSQFQSHPQSPVYEQAPPLPPHPPQRSPTSPYPTRTSSWNVPYPPEDGLRRIGSREAASYRPDHAQHYREYQPRQQQTPRQQSPQPHYHEQYQPQSFALPPQLDSKSKNDLSHVLSTPDLLQAFLQVPETAPPSLTESQRRLQAQLAANTALATSLKTLEGTLEAARNNTSARLLRVRGLETGWKKKQGELERRLEPWGPRELHQRLGQAIAEQEGLCGAVEGSFVEGGGASESGVAGEREVVEWLKRVREGRSLVALRRERKRRWDEGRVGGWR